MSLWLRCAEVCSAINVFGAIRISNARWLVSGVMSRAPEVSRRRACHALIFSAFVLQSYVSFILAARYCGRVHETSLPFSLLLYCAAEDQPINTLCVTYT